MKKVYFIRIPEPLLTDRKLRAIDHTVYGMIDKFCRLRKGRCTATNKAIGEYLGVSRSTVAGSIFRLEERRYIQRIQQQKNSSGHQQRHIKIIDNRLLEEGENIPLELRPDSGEVFTNVDRGVQNSDMTRVQNLDRGVQKRGRGCPETWTGVSRNVENTLPDSRLNKANFAEKSPRIENSTRTPTRTVDKNARARERADQPQCAGGNSGADSSAGSIRRKGDAAGETSPPASEPSAAPDDMPPRAVMPPLAASPAAAKPAPRFDFSFWAPAFRPEWGEPGEPDPLITDMALAVALCFYRAGKAPPADVLPARSPAELRNLAIAREIWVDRDDPYRVHPIRKQVVWLLRETRLPLGAVDDADVIERFIAFAESSSASMRKNRNYLAWYRDWLAPRRGARQFEFTKNAEDKWFPDGHWTDSRGLRCFISGAWDRSKRMETSYTREEEHVLLELESHKNRVEWERAHGLRTL